MKVVGEVDDGLDLLNLLKNLQHNGGYGCYHANTNGFETIQRIKQNYPDIKVLVLTINNYKEYLNRAMVHRCRRLRPKRGMDLELVPA